MLTFVNPGTAASTSGDAWHYAFFIAFVVSIALCFIGLITTELHGRHIKALQIGLFVGVGIGLAAVVACGAISLSTHSDDHRDYRVAVQSWLSSEYNIEVTEDETRTLISRNEFGVELDGNRVAIKLIDGSGDVLQVQEVGGRIIDPRSDD